MQSITPFLMFAGNAEAAMNFYLDIFPGSEIKSISRYGEAGPGAAGTVHHAIFSLGKQEFMCIDSPVAHGFSFTPAISLHVGCTTLEEVNHLAARLGAGGQFLMPLGEYPFSKRYAWLNDKFGVSWQLMLVDG